MEMLLLLIGFVIGFLVGLLIVWIVLKTKINSTNDDAELKNKNAELEKQVARIEAECEQYEKLILEYKDNLNALIAENKELHSSLKVSENNLKNLNDKLETKKNEIENLQKKLILEFENLANKVLDEKTKSFNEFNKTQLNAILNPFSENLKEFKSTVKETYEKGLKERTELSTELKQIQRLNVQLQEEASNLTKALKGDSQKQGRWGEMILEKILESSGLEKGIQYRLQDSFTIESGKRFRPDAVVYLPENKHIIVDSKVSLVAYEKYCNAETDEERTKYIKEHIQSIRNHIKDLSSKDYINNLGIENPEYLLMFIPIEASFSAAMTHNNSIFNEAWDNRIVIVSPATLIATLMTVSAIWKQNLQTENALEIAERGGKLYEKFVSFVEDLNRVGQSISKASADYENAMKKLSTGSGNLVKQTEMLRKLGAKTTKSLHTNIITKSLLDDHVAELPESQE
ncbi:DNA recombination protein RmuC [Bacteroidales bacterium OttesenSCG-928-I21]|nr:DNA recombination protein RmuC [Bacteroidales bacterium OttesenSCG-928-I21]